MKQENYVRLKILGDEYTPDELNNLLGLSCDKSWLAGELRKNTQIKEKSNGWIIESKLAKSDDLDKHLNSLLNCLEKHESVIMKVSGNNNVEFSCAIYSDEIPALYFEKDIIRRISNLGANFDVDLYLTESK